MSRIAAGLEQAFVDNGFAEPSVESLRDAAGVSMRTLYKYAPSRGDMVLAALEHRHGRYIDHVFSDLPDNRDLVLPAVIDRIATWMSREAAHGCLFHAAVAAAPHDRALHALLERHKADVTGRTATAAGLGGREVDLALILDGLTQNWPLHGPTAADSAKRLAALL